MQRNYEEEAFRPISDEEVRKVIKSLSDGKLSGCDP